VGNSLDLASQKALWEGVQLICWASAGSLGEDKTAAEAARFGPQQVSPTGTWTQP